MSHHYIAPIVKMKMTEIQQSIKEVEIILEAANIFPERKEEIKEELEKVLFVLDTLYVENNYDELEKCHIYIESIRINIPNWEGNNF